MNPQLHRVLCAIVAGMPSFLTGAMWAFDRAAKRRRLLDSYEAMWGLEIDFDRDDLSPSAAVKDIVAERVATRLEDAAHAVRRGRRVKL